MTLFVLVSQTCLGSIDSKIYDTMSEILYKYHPEKTKEIRECIIEEMQSKDEAENFSSDSFDDEQKLAEEMEPLLPTYEIFCTTSRTRIEIVSIIIGGIIFIAIVIIVAVCNNKIQTPNEPEIIVETVV